MSNNDEFSGANSPSATPQVFLRPDVELWKACASAPGYEVSDRGQVRRMSTGRILAQRRHRSGLAVAVAVRRAGALRSHTRLVHLLVLEAFHGPKQPGMVVYALDGDLAHATKGNLQWRYRRDVELRPNTAAVCLVCPTCRRPL